MYSCVFHAHFLNLDSMVPLSSPSPPPNMLNYYFFIVALAYVLRHKKSVLPQCNLTPYSDFLGLHVTQGTHTKEQNLHDIVSEPLLVEVLQVNVGRRRLTDYLDSLGMVLTKDNVIRTRPGASKKENR